MGPRTKKSKKQIEEEKRVAEEERRIQEELDAKLAAEEAERQRIAEEKRRAEEEKRRQEELARLVQERPEFDDRSESMVQNSKHAAKHRVQDLDEKYLACDPLPKVEDEKDITTFITLWKETSDANLKEAIDNCQIAENVIQSMQDISGEALSMYEKSKLDWCRDYTDQLREIELRKFNEICAHILEYMEVHTKLSSKEIDANKKNTNQRVKGDQTMKEKLTMVERTDDLLFGVWANVQGKSVIHDKIEFNKFKSGLPMKQAAMTLIFRCLWTSFDYLSYNTQQDDIVIGGVVDFQMYSYPDKCETSNKWVMRNVLTVEERLKNVPFPDPAVTMVESPVEIVYHLPETIYTTEDATSVKIGVWNYKTQSWSIDPIGGDCEFKRASRTISFTTTKFAPLAMLQSRCTDYPYKNWWLRCVDDQKALLDLTTKRLKLHFEIGPQYLKLVDNNCPELKHLVDREIHPGFLLQELSKCGIHLMPNDEDAKLGGIQLKDQQAEEMAIVDVACSVRAFHYRKCRWNHGTSAEEPGVPKDQIVLRIRENLEFDKEFLEDDENDWRQVVWWANKCSFVNGCKDTDAKCNVQIAEGQETHCLLTQAIGNEVCSEQAYLTAQDYTPIEFIDTMKKTLRLLRLLSFS